jgi:hypothetical protein
VRRFAAFSSAARRAAGVLIFPALAMWEPAAGTLPGLEVAPATPVAIATAAATAASVTILVHPNIKLLPFYAMGAATP